jgi:hypothetical protein
MLSPPRRCLHNHGVTHWLIDDTFARPRRGSTEDGKGSLEFAYISSEDRALLGRWFARHFGEINLLPGPTRGLSSWVILVYGTRTCHVKTCEGNPDLFLPPVGRLVDLLTTPAKDLRYAPNPELSKTFTETIGKRAAAAARAMMAPDN